MSNKELTPNGQNRNWRTPACDICELKDKFEVLLDMPGVTKDELEITYQNGSLYVTGHVKKHDNEQLKSSKREYVAADFRREFTISDQSVAVDKIEAALENGELKLTLPKSENTKPRKIEIKTL